MSRVLEFPTRSASDGVPPTDLVSVPGDVNLADTPVSSPTLMPRPASASSAASVGDALPVAASSPRYSPTPSPMLSRATAPVPRPTFWANVLTLSNAADWACRTEATTPGLLAPARSKTSAVARVMAAWLASRPCEAVASKAALCAVVMDLPSALASMPAVPSALAVAVSTARLAVFRIHRDPPRVRVSTPVITAPLTTPSLRVWFRSSSVNVPSIPRWIAFPPVSSRVFAPNNPATSPTSPPTAPPANVPAPGRNADPIAAPVAAPAYPNPRATAELGA